MSKNNNQDLTLYNISSDGVKYPIIGGGLQKSVITGQGTTDISVEALIGGFVLLEPSGTLNITAPVVSDVLAITGLIKDTLVFETVFHSSHPQDVNFDENVLIMKDEKNNRILTHLQNSDGIYSVNYYISNQTDYREDS